MKKIFNLDGHFKCKSLDEDSGIIQIEGYASTSDVDRVGDVITPDAWTVSNGLNSYKSNPIILFNHDHGKPIGRATSMEVDNRGLKITAEIFQKAAGELYDIIKAGVLTTFSVGFKIKDAEWRDETNGFLITDAELFETSVVSLSLIHI